MTESLDRQLIATLCRNGRADIRDLAAETDAVPTTIQKRLRALEESDTIGGYTARINYDAIGYETVIFQLDVDLDVIDDVTERLREMEAFVTVYETSGDSSIFAIGNFKTTSAIAACLHTLHESPDIGVITTNAVTSTLLEGDCPL